MQRNTAGRFTVDGGSELEAQLEEMCARIRSEVQALVPAGDLEGLLLAGGYGRGEGGVLVEGGRERPYNDLEFYVFIRGGRLLAERTYGDPLHQLGRRLTIEADLETEFKVLTLDHLRGSGPSMFYHDLVEGHRWLVGDETLLAGCEHHRAADRIPLHEATRLLMNRCSGLLFSAERLRRARFGAEESDYVGRNLAKLRLALGDVLLTAAGRYHWSCRERHRRLLQPEPGLDRQWGAAVSGHHAAGVAFKLRPVRSAESRAALTEQHRALSASARDLWLWLEERRLQTVFRSARAYALSPEVKCPETSAWRNRLVNARAFGPQALLRGGSSRYPRERLLRSLCLLLWEETAIGDRAVLRRIQRELGSGADDFHGLVAAYERLWHRFN